MKYITSTNALLPKWAVGLAQRINFLYLLVSQCKDFFVNLAVHGLVLHSPGVSELSAQGAAVHW